MIWLSIASELVDERKQTPGSAHANQCAVIFSVSPLPTEPFCQSSHPVMGIPANPMKTLTENFFNSHTFACLHSMPGVFFQGAKITMLKAFSLLLVAILLAVLATPVSAHAILVRSTPKAHEVVPSGDVKMKLEFNSRIDAARSILELALPSGEIQRLQLLPQPSPAALAATAAHLTPGKYTIRWQVLSNDGHITRGEIPFEVK